MNPAPTAESIHEHLATVLASGAFRGSERSCALLSYLVERTLRGEGERLKEYTIGVEALGRSESFDPRTDPIVRAEASRLRRRLEQYYAGEARDAPVTIVLPKGGYAVRFEPRSALPEPRAELSRAPAGRAVSFVLGAALGAAGLGIALTMLWPDAQVAEAPVVELDVELRSSGTLGSEVGTDVVVSPDGTLVAFVSSGADRRGRLNIRRLDDPAVRELPETDGARAPFFSPDSRWVGFWADRAIKKVAVDGGSPVVLAETSDLLGASWAEDGSILAATGFSVLSRIPASGGTPSIVLDLASDSSAALWPHLLPGGTHALVTVMSRIAPDEAAIELLSLEDGKRDLVVRGGTFGRYVSANGAGFVLYVNQGTLFALPFDVERKRARGTAFPVLDNVAYVTNFGYAQLDVSPSGVLVYQRAGASAHSVVAWVDSAGRVEPLPFAPGAYSRLSLSPEADRMLLGAIESGVLGFSLYDFATQRRTHLDTGAYTAPAWSPYGHGLVLGGNGGLAWIPTGVGAEAKPRALVAGGPAVPWSFSRDGGRVAYHRRGDSTGFDLWTVALTTASDGAVTVGSPEPFLETSAMETWPTFSPDGRWLAYASNESGVFEVYVRAFPDGRAQVRVSDGGGRIAAWSRNGRELLYGTDDDRVMVAPYSIEDGAFVAQKAREWTPVRLADTGVMPNFDVAPDGERLVALLPADARDAPARDHVTFVFNFFERLR
jgi:serine/threonine-protein kinase